jgi:hypothetical protein
MGNPVPALGIATIPQLNVVPLPQNLAGYMWQVQNVTISGALPASGLFSNQNLNLTITDSNNSGMQLYYWPSSISVSLANLYNRG